MGTGQKDGNLYFELNVMLRVRVASGRDALKATWSGYMFYFVKGLAELPNYRGECWRGYNHGTRAQILEQYSVGRPIQWGAFTSVTTSRAAAESFAPETRVLFKIRVTSGKTEIESFLRAECCVRFLPPDAWIAHRQVGISTPTPSSRTRARFCFHRPPASP